MAKTGAKTGMRRSGILEGVVRHKPCGWISRGKSFVEGAGCPNCEQRIFSEDVEEVTDFDETTAEEDE